MIEPVPFFWPLICSVAAKRTVAAVQSVSCVFRDPTGTIYSMTLPLSRSIVASTAVRPNQSIPKILRRMARC